MTKFRHQLGGSALYLMTKAVRKSGRFQVSGLGNLQEAQADGRPLIFAAWHGMTMMLVGLLADLFDPAQFMLLMPDDWRGETLRIFAQRMGAHPYPVNLKGDKTLAAARQLVSLVRTIKGGKFCYINPDGPDGPAYVVKPGTVYIAQKAAGVIVPLGAYARHAYHVNRWDHYTIPYPFSRISVHVGPPLVVGKEEELTAVSAHLTNLLHRAAAQATANYYENSHLPDAA